MSALPLSDVGRKVSRGLREIPLEIRHLGRGHYPAFVTARRSVRLDHVPVFMYHAVAADTFREQMEYLRVNGYRTLTLPQFMALRAEGRPPREPSVLLTFDDGDRTLYDVAYPTLEGYGFHAVAFVVPHYLREQADPDDRRSWIAWSEAREMEKSGVVDIQSHTYFHARVFVSPERVDFFHPGYSQNGLGLDVPWIDGEAGYTNDLPWGAPIYHHAMRLAGELRYRDNRAVRRACADWVARRGGAGFFQQSGWRGKLAEVYRRALVEHGEGRYETARERRDAMWEELARARRVLEERLDKSVHHLCYPQGSGSPLAVQLSQEAGYRSNFWVARPDDGTPYAIPRLKDDYLFRLPGRGRLPLLRIFYRKLARRAQTLDLY